jgi:hypothetical protein
MGAGRRVTVTPTSTHVLPHEVDSQHPPAYGLSRTLGGRGLHADRTPPFDHHVPVPPRSALGESFVSDDGSSCVMDMGCA